MQKYPEKVAKMQPLGWGWVVRRRNLFSSLINLEKFQDSTALL